MIASHRVRVQSTILALSVLLASPVAAQRLTSQSAAQLIGRAADELERGYVFPGAGRLMADSLRARAARGAYAALLAPDSLAAKLTVDLRALSSDRHLSIRPVRSAPAPAATSPARPPERTRPSLVVLPDSVGYLKVVVFDDQVRSSLPELMSKVTSLNAFIIDIRESPGGGAEPFLALAGYLLPQRTRLGNLYSRLDDSTIEMWTEEPVGARYRGPVFVLTSRRTFSAAEAFAYHLKALRRVTVVGDTTGGGAHRVRGVDLGEGVTMALPYTRVLNAVTGTDWEGTGVIPDVPADSSQALEAALRLIRGPAQRPPLESLPPRMIRDVVSGALSYLKKYYAVPEMVSRADSIIRTRMTRGTYDTLRTGQRLTERLTADFLEVTADKHLRLVFDPKGTAGGLDTVRTPAQREAEDRAFLEYVGKEGKSRNFGFDAVRRLPGNVGYLNLSTFFPRDMSLPTARGAFAVLAATDAVVIDLRNNSGGDPQMVGWLAGMFVDRVVATGLREDRLSGRTDTSYVRPTEGNEAFVAKPLYILTAKAIYSAPEAFAISLQRIGRAKVVGERTAGGAHLTSPFRIDAHFTLRLPHARPIPDWEGIGVAPDIDVTAERALQAAHLAALERLQQEQPNAYPELVQLRRQLIEQMRAASRP